MPAGRPSKLTPELLKSLCQELERGLTRADACALVDIDYSQFHRWWHGKDEKHHEFRKAVKKAEASVKAVLTQFIKSAGGESWQALAWLLERRWPMDYGLSHRRFEAEVRADFAQRIQALPIELQEAISNALESSGSGGEPSVASVAPEENSEEH